MAEEWRREDGRMKTALRRDYSNFAHNFRTVLSQIVCAKVTPVSSPRRSLAMIGVYARVHRAPTTMEIVAMLHCNPAPSGASVIRSIASVSRCPHCGDRMVAPTLSEFVEGGEIRHHWICEACAQTSVTSFALTTS